MMAGATAPPTAAATGSAAPRTDDSSPTRTSRLISSPTTKKKIAMSPSLIQWVRCLGEGEVAQADRQLRSPQRGVAGAPGRVGPDEGRCCYDYQDDAAGGLLVGEVLEGAYDP